jgi:hypothetical protein
LFGPYDNGEQKDGDSVRKLELHDQRHSMEYWAENNAAFTFAVMTETSDAPGSIVLSPVFSH